MLCMAAREESGQTVTRVPQWTVGDRLRKAREEAGIGVEQMAAQIGRNRNSITRYERSRTVDVLVVRAYSAFTATSMTWLLTGTGPDDEEGESAITPVTLRELDLISRGNSRSLKVAA